MSRRLHVQNLSHGVGRAELERLFEPFGNVKSVRVVDLLKTAKTTATGFVEMETEAQGQAAMDALNGTQYRGAHLVVTWAELVPGKGLNLSRMFEPMNVPGPTPIRLRDVSNDHQHK